METTQLSQLVYAAGVVGAGGAGFPTHVKLRSTAEIVIVNGAECEPLLQVDKQLAEREADALVAGLGAVVTAVSAKQGVVALKAKQTDAVASVKKAVLKDHRLSLFTLPDYYPAGDEQALVYQVTGKVVPEGGIPLAVGAVVLNVETVLNITGALHSHPVTHTYLTVAGAVKQPLTVRAPVGTSIDQLLSVAGGPNVEHYRVVSGGPLTGTLVQQDFFDHSGGVSKTTKGIIVLPADHPLVRQAETPLSAILRQAQSACCQCRICTDLCPRRLLGHSIEPSQVLNAVNHQLGQDIDAITQAFLCCECGVCDLYACPLGLSPRRMYQALKAELIVQGAVNPHRLSPTQPRPERVGRQIPTSRLLERLDLARYSQPAPWASQPMEVSVVRIPLKQHIGTPAQPCIGVGDSARAGQTVAEPRANSLGALVHASIAGRVLRITDTFIEIGGGDSGIRDSSSWND